jgi:hypothetical protein
MPMAERPAVSQHAVVVVHPLDVLAQKIPASHSLMNRSSRGPSVFSANPHRIGRPLDRHCSKVNGVRFCGSAIRVADPTEHAVPRPGLQLHFALIGVI